LRLEAGTSIDLFNNTGLEFGAQIVHVAKNSVQIVITTVKASKAESLLDLHLGQGYSAETQQIFIALQGVQQHKDLVHIARLQNNRVIYNTPKPKLLKKTKRRERGHELWYGVAFNLKDESTHGMPDNTQSVSYKTRKGKNFTAQIESWNDMLMRQKDGIPLNEYPFTAVRITITDQQNNQVYKRSMWLMVAGERRGELTLSQTWESYAQRYDIEHYFKFAKTKLLMNKFQTPDVKREESWWQISSLAYAQLYMACELANNLPNPWEKYLPAMKDIKATVKSARQVQKSFAQITSEIGAPASAPKPRGIQLGRELGQQLTRRKMHPIIFKGEKALETNTT
jgi:hypothetical protein